MAVGEEEEEEGELERGYGVDSSTKEDTAEALCVVNGAGSSHLCAGEGGVELGVRGEEDAIVDTEGKDPIQGIARGGQGATAVSSCIMSFTACVAEESEGMVVVVCTNEIEHRRVTIPVTGTASSDDSILVLEAAIPHAGKAMGNEASTRTSSSPFLVLLCGVRGGGEETARSYSSR